MSEFSRGARIAVKDTIKKIELTAKEMEQPPRRNADAVELVYHNRHKPWARRWLRLNRSG